MKSKDAEYEDDGLFANEETFNKRFRRLEGEELAEHKRRIAKAVGTQTKTRVTIYFDASVIDSFKERARREGTGYQTLINRELRRIVAETTAAESKAELKEELLNDEQFLSRLKKKLAA